MAPPKKPPSLKSGRPPTAKKPLPQLSSKATQQTIVTFHNLTKALAAARARDDPPSHIAALEAALARLGGLPAYQAASMLGQSSSRGGDSSVVLLRWLAPEAAAQRRWRVLEIGALSTRNACARVRGWEVERIDLNSQDRGIVRQDFMQRPLPRGSGAAADGDRFDVVSLSLVLNFVPEAGARGDMLRRTTKFLRRRAGPEGPAAAEGAASAGLSGRDEERGALLFLVLPASCVLNSRYFNDERLALIMAALGYVLLQRKQTAKLVYYLWQWRDEPEMERHQRFGKVKVRDGPGMNNFWVGLEPGC